VIKLRARYLPPLPLRCRCRNGGARRGRPDDRRARGRCAWTGGEASSPAGQRCRVQRAGPSSPQPSCEVLASRSSARPAQRAAGHILSPSTTERTRRGRRGVQYPSCLGAETSQKRASAEAAGGVWRSWCFAGVLLGVSCHMSLTRRVASLICHVR
jgi:hypothetical protein